MAEQHGLCLSWLESRKTGFLASGLILKLRCSRISAVHEKTCLWSFLTRSDTNRAVQVQKMAGRFKFQIKEKEVLNLLYGKNEGKMHSNCTADLCIFT